MPKWGHAASPLERLTPLFDLLKNRAPRAGSDTGSDTNTGTNTGADAGHAHWAQVRRDPRDCDRALTGTTRRWLRELPPRRRPLRLCEVHPRVANRIAWCWQDAILSDALLDDLLVDRRGGRNGFSPIVVRELRRLREFNAQHRIETGPEGLLEIAARVVGMR